MKNFTTTWKMNFLIASLLFILSGIFNFLQAQENFTTIGYVNNGNRLGEYGLVLDSRFDAIHVGNFNIDNRSDFILYSSGALGVISTNSRNKIKTITRGSILGANSWRLNATDQIVGVGNFYPNLKEDFIIKSNTHIGIIGLDDNDRFTTITSLLNGSYLANNAWRYYSTDKVLGVGKFNGDNRSDFIIKSNTHIGVITLNNTKQFTAITSLMSGSTFGTSGWLYQNSDKILGVGDFNRDGRSDFIIKSSSHLGIISLDANNKFRTVTSKLMGKPLGNSGWVIKTDDEIFGVGDFNNDGRNDFIIKSNTHLGIISLDRSGNFYTITAQLLGKRLVDGGFILKTDDLILDVGDFNGDSRSDFIIKSKTHLALISLNEFNKFKALASRSYGSTSGPNGWILNKKDQVLGVGDFNVDGRSDIVIRDTRGIGIIGLELPASCGEPARYAGERLWLDKCYKHDFNYTPTSTNKNVVVYYTETNGNPMDRIRAVDTDGNGTLNMTTNNIATKVAEWVEQGWKTYLSYGFNDPMGSNKLDVHLFEFGKPGWCCHAPANQPPDMEFSANSALESFNFDNDLRRDPRNGKSIIFHELWHASESSGVGGALSEGIATVMSDQVDIDTDIYSSTGYNNNISNYLNGSYRNTLEIHDYEGALWWKYYMEQFGTITTEPRQGTDAILRLWQNPPALSLTTLKNAITSLGTRTLESTWIDFTIANYAKQLNLSPHPAKYKYLDELQTGASRYSNVSQLELSNVLLTSTGTFTNGTTPVSIQPWSSRYYALNIDSSVQTISININQSTNRRVGYSILKLKGNRLTEDKQVSRNFNRSIENLAYDKIIIVITGLPEEQNASITYNIRG